MSGIYIGNCENKKHSDFTPQSHQKLLQNFMLNSSNKGILLFHRLGSGKTCTSIMIADSLMKEKGYKHTYVLTPGTLRENFISEYCKVCGDNLKNFSKNYTFITYNYNVANSIKKLDFDNSVIIVDEAHNLINGVKNISYNPLTIYRKIENAKNAKVILLTGTPIYNNTIEVPIFMNLIKPGAMKNVTLNLEKEGIDMNYFEDRYFIKNEFGKIISLNEKKADELFEALRNVISFFPGFSEEYYPKRIDIPIIKVVMSEPQIIEYLGKEFTERIYSIPPSPYDPDYAFKKTMYIMAKKNILTRQSSNIYYPVFTYKDKKSEKLIFEKNEQGYFTKENELVEYKNLSSIPDKLISKGGWISFENLRNKLKSIYSPKLAALFKNILENFEGKHFIYSFFKDKGGINLIASILDLCGQKYIKITGDVSIVKRQKDLDKFNDPENKYGNKIKFILVTDAGAEGITTKCVRAVHILESDKRGTKIEQIIGRAIRFKSHEDLPHSQRTVKIFRYWSVTPKIYKTYNIKYIDENGKTKSREFKLTPDYVTIDEILYQTALINLNNINAILSILEEASVN